MPILSIFYNARRQLVVATGLAGRLIQILRHFGCMLFLAVIHLIDFDGEVPLRWHHPRGVVITGLRVLLKFHQLLFVGAAAGSGDDGRAVVKLEHVGTDRIGWTNDIRYLHSIITIIIGQYIIHYTILRLNIGCSDELVVMWEGII